MAVPSDASYWIASGDEAPRSWRAVFRLLGRVRQSARFKARITSRGVVGSGWVSWPEPRGRNEPAGFLRFFAQQEGFGGTRGE
jgi:hypothetical protein